MELSAFSVESMAHAPKFDTITLPTVPISCRRVALYSSAEMNSLRGGIVTRSLMLL